MNLVSLWLLTQLAVLAGPPAPQPVLITPLKGNAVRSVAVAPDGSRVAAVASGPLVQQWELASGREVTAIKLPAPASDIGFAADGKRLVTLSRSLDIWDANGKPAESRTPNVTATRLACAAEGPLAVASHRVKLISTNADMDGIDMPEQAGWANTCLAFNAEGTRLAAGDQAGNVWLWDASGTLKLRRKVHINKVTGIGFIDDGALLVTGGLDGKMTFWDLKGGREVGAVVPHGTGTGKGIAGLVCSFDGRVIATVGIGDSTIRLWEASSGRLRATLAVPPVAWTSLSLSLDGSTLAAGGKLGNDGVVIAWRLYATDTRLGPPVRAALWSELAGDAPCAYRAILGLASHPREGVELLRQRLRPVVLDAATRKECDGLIAVLGDETFSVRDDAFHRLELMSPWIEAHLKKALPAAKTLEVQRRLQTLITTVGETTLPLLRAVEALEHAPGPEARKLLREIAAGEPDARITREARRAVERKERLESSRP